LKAIFDQARSLELAMRNSESYSGPPSSVNVAIPPTTTVDQERTEPSMLAAVGSNASPQAPSCFFCGNSNHPRSKCPAQFALIVKRTAIFQKFAVERR